ncbi:TPA: expansin [Trebouxia sp. C0005]
MDKTQYPYWSVAALSPSNPFYIAGPIAACGQCFEIQCLNSGGQFAGRCNSDPSQRSTTVMISDVCPECEADHLDIQALTYDKIAPMLSGRIDIQYRRVQCTPPSNLVVNIDQNSGTGGFLKMSVSTAGGSGGISSVQVKGPNTAWTGLHNLYGAEWELDTQPQLPLDIHIIADTGAEVTAFSAITQNGVTGVLPTGVQFTFGGPPSYNEASSIDSSGSSAPSSTPQSSAESPPESSSESSIQSDIASASAGGASASASGSSQSIMDDRNILQQSKRVLCQDLRQMLKGNGFGAVFYSK